MSLFNVVGMHFCYCCCCFCCCCCKTYSCSLWWPIKRWAFKRSWVAYVKKIFIQLATPYIHLYVCLCECIIMLHLHCLQLLEHFSSPLPISLEYSLLSFLIFWHSLNTFTFPFSALVAIVACHMYTTFFIISLFNIK